MNSGYPATHRWADTPQGGQSITLNTYPTDFDAEFDGVYQ